MKIFAGFILIIVGIAVGIYVGLWLCFIGGIVGIINAIKTPEPVTAMVIAWNLLRIFGAGVAGYVSALIFVIPGIALIRR